MGPPRPYRGVEGHSGYPLSAADLRLMPRRGRAPHVGGHDHAALAILLADLVRTLWLRDIIAGRSGRRSLAAPAPAAHLGKCSPTNTRWQRKPHAADSALEEIARFAPTSSMTNNKCG
jgi:hypothetical protein